MKNITRTFRVREGTHTVANLEARTFDERPFMVLDDEPLPDNATVNSDRIVVAVMPVHDFYAQATIKDKR